MPKKASDEYSDKEAQKRFEAALRGARVTGHKPMDAVRKRKPSPQKPKKRT